MAGKRNSITTAEQYEQTRARIAALADAYYNSDTLLADDDEYDALVAAARKWEADHQTTSPETSEVAAGVGTGDVTHRRAMLSLDNAMGRDELDRWLTGTKPDQVHVEPKMDGLAIVATYRAGQLTLVATRGDGKAGENITANATSIIGLPRQLTETVDVEVRGECYLDHGGLEAANSERINRGKPPFVNPRNAVAGMIRSRNERYETPLLFACYDLELLAGTQPFDTGSETMRYASRLGIATAAQLLEQIGGNSASLDSIDLLTRARQTLGFDVDGCVIKTDSYSQRQQLGNSSRAPRWAIAYKFPAETKLTTLEAITVTVGRTGNLSFVGELTPVFVGQATVSRATLHNPTDMLARIGRDGVIYTNVDVFVRRAGDVIPEIVGLAGEPGAGATPWAAPTSCPRCHSPLDTSGVIVKCSEGRRCGLTEWISYAAGRTVLDIEGLGDTIVAQLTARGHVTSVADLYQLDVATLTALPRVGDKKATQILSQIERAKQKPLANHLASLGIPTLGTRLSQRVADTMGDIDRLLGASVEQLTAIDGVGDKKAVTISEGLAELASVIEQLKAVGANLTQPQPAGDSGDGPLAGQIVVVTGSIPGLDRHSADARVAALGGKTAGSVTSRTTLLVAGENAGSKLAKAEQLGIRVIDADAFLALEPGA